MNALPGYARLEEAGKLDERVERAYAVLEACELCPRRCRVNRRRGETGFCRTAQNAVVSGADAHFGEEDPLVGNNGSGTIFFSYCNLRCHFCQNAHIAHDGLGRTVSDAQLASMMLDLQRRGCHNVNAVTPTHVLPNVVGALRTAGRSGLRLPLCYNTGGYDSIESIQLLDGIADLYLADIKFMDPNASREYVSAGPADYSERATEAVREMHRQVGDLVTDGRGIAQRGLMIRHLVMPDNVAGTDRLMRWIAGNLSPHTYVNIMAQYTPAHHAHQYPRIARPITAREFADAVEAARDAGLTNIDRRALLQYESLRRRLR